MLPGRRPERAARTCLRSPGRAATSTKDRRGAAPKQRRRRAQARRRRAPGARRRRATGSWRRCPAAQGALVSLNPEDGAIEAHGRRLQLPAQQVQPRHAGARASRVRASSRSSIRRRSSMASPRPRSSTTRRSCSPIRRDRTACGRRRTTTASSQGPMRLREALVQSKNLVSVRLLDAIGVHYAREYITRFGFAPEQIPDNLSMALGTASVSPLAMARGYAVFANGGYLVDPYLISEIDDRDGNVVYRGRSRRAPADLRRAPARHAPRGRTPTDGAPQHAERRSRSAPAPAATPPAASRPAPQVLAPRAIDRAQRLPGHLADARRDPARHRLRRRWCSSATTWPARPARPTTTATPGSPASTANLVASVLGRFRRLQLARPRRIRRQGGAADLDRFHAHRAQGRAGANLRHAAGHRHACASIPSSGLLAGAGDPGAILEVMKAEDATPAGLAAAAERREERRAEQSLRHVLRCPATPATHRRACTKSRRAHRRRSRAPDQRTRHARLPSGQAQGRRAARHRRRPQPAANSEIEDALREHQRLFRGEQQTADRCAALREAAREAMRFFGASSRGWSARCSKAPPTSTRRSACTCFGSTPTRSPSILREHGIPLRAAKPAPAPRSRQRARIPRLAVRRRRRRDRSHRAAATTCCVRRRSIASAKNRCSAPRWRRWRSCSTSR